MNRNRLITIIAVVVVLLLIWMLFFGAADEVAVDDVEDGVAVTTEEAVEGD